MFALLCVVAAAILTFVLYPKVPQLTGNTDYREQVSDYRPGGLNCQKTGKIDTRIANFCKEEAENHRIQENELLQQERSATAAEAAAIAVFEQTRINAFALTLGFITMIAAIAAAYFAREAARHTSGAAQEAKRSADAAEQTLTHTKSANQTTIRPWIAIKSPMNGKAYNSSFNGIMSEEAIIFHCLIKNESNYPATNCSIVSDYSIVRQGDPVPHFDHPYPDVPNIVASGETLSTGFMPIFGHDLVEFRNRRILIIVWVKVGYKGTFGDQQISWETEACFEVSHKGGTMGTAGNEGEAILTRPIGDQNRMN